MKEKKNLVKVIAYALLLLAMLGIGFGVKLIDVQELKKVFIFDGTTLVKLLMMVVSILLLERVITELGTLKKVDSHVVESLFTADMAYLQDLYQKINAVEPQFTNITCPKCSHEFRYELPFFGEA